MEESIYLLPEYTPFKKIFTASLPDHVIKHWYQHLANKPLSKHQKTLLRKYGVLDAEKRGRKPILTEEQSQEKLRVKWKEHKKKKKRENELKQLNYSIIRTYSKSRKKVQTKKKNN